MQNTNKIDRVSILLLLFVALVSSLFLYLYKIEKKTENHNSSHDKIVSLKLIDRQLNDFSIDLNNLSNYDTVNHNLSKFKIILHTLEKNLHTVYPNNIVLQQQLQRTEKIFRKKAENLEYFKSLNSSLISGSHFLYDLQRTIADNKKITTKTKSLVNEALFYLLRYTSSDYIDKSYVEQKIEALNKLSQQNRQHLIQNFYKQSSIMLNTLDALKETSSEIHRSGLYKLLTVLHTELDTIYKQDIFIQKIIVLFFFIFTILVLLALLVSHYFSLKREKELYAFKYAVEHSDNTIVITDTDRHITFVNEGFEKATGYTKEEALGQNPNILKSGEQDENFYKELNTKLDKGEKWEGQFINKRKDGSLYYEKASIVPIMLNGKLMSYLAIKLNITEYVEQNRKLEQAASVFENTEEAIIISDQAGLVSSINSAFTNMYGYTIDDVLGKSLNILHSGFQDKYFYEEMWDKINKNGLWRGKFINKSKNGETIPVWTTIKKIVDHKGKVINYTAIQTDLREIEESQAKADYLAYHDALTGLYNRVSFEEYLSHALAIAKRNEHLLSIFFIDLDRFKVINDTLGHDIGDQVLITVASRLKTVLRESDFISRWGGDEFVVILENVLSASDTAVIATNLISALKEPMEINGHHLITTASIGISLYPENGTDANTLIKHADSAMYQAKDSGKNNFSYYTTELSEQIQSKLDIDMALHNAVQNNEIYMVFQPQYNLKNRKIIAIESLVRWKNAKLGFIPPDKFIPVAEDSGTIVPLGYFIFEESCKAYKKMKENAVTLSHIAINVSSIQFKEPHLLETFISIAKRHNIEPTEIEIEITERFLMEHTVANINLLQNFRNYGFQISIDDFGTGYSSMSYLKQLPVDTIKIDKSFVDDIKEGSDDNVIIEAIIALSKTLGYSIVAEGIETEEQETFLASVDCDIGQGYLFSRPISCDEIISRFSS